MKQGYPKSSCNQSNSQWNWRHILSHQGQSKTNAVKAQDYGNSVLGLAQCFASGLYATRNKVPTTQLYGISESIAKQTAYYADKRCLAPPR
ncbi:hypothetical protein TNCV_1273591 [Trichonephila clavipes]|nr:hypothetical protein TNCV_1273591 [Trichonephila clavipes]